MESITYSKNHWITITVLFSLWISILGSEWVQGKDTIFYFDLRLITRILPTVLMVFVVLGILLLKKNPFIVQKKYVLGWHAFGVVFILVVLIFRVGLYSKSAHDHWIALQIIQSIMFGYVGYWLSQDKTEAKWLLEKVAFIGVFVGLFDAFATILSISDTSLLFPSFPVRLIVLFGYCWFFYRWLKYGKNNTKTLLNLIGCSAGVLVTFHKPIVFSAFFSTIFLIYYTSGTAKQKALVLKRFFLVLLFFSTSVFAINYATSGAVSQAISETVYEQFLRVTPGTKFTELHYDDLDGISGSRLIIWPMAIERIKQSPWLGTGIRNIYTRSDGVEIHSHNWFLDLLLWVGIIGALPFFVGLLWWFNFARKKTNHEKYKDLVIPSFCYTIGLMAYNLGGSMLSFYTMTTFAVLIIAVTKRYTEG